MNKNIKTEITNYGEKRLDEIAEKTFAWMDGENTVGDFVTAFVEQAVEEWLGEDICSMTIAMVDNDKNAQTKIFERICECPFIDVFVKANKPEQLMEA